MNAKHFIAIIILFLSGCGITQSGFQKKRQVLKEDVELLKLEIRKERLENELEKLEKE